MSDFAIDDMKEIIDDFLIEADELLLSLDTNLVELENRPDDSDLLNEIFRAAHTIKGTSSFLGLENVTTLAHRMEDVLNKLRKNELVLSADIMDVLLRSLDILKNLIENVKNNDENKPETTTIIDELTKIFNGETVTAIKKKTEQPENIINQKIAEPIPVESQQQVEPENTPADNSTGNSPKQAKTKNSEQTIRVGVDRLDSLLNMMGELVLGRNSMIQAVTDLTHKYDGEDELGYLSQTANNINFITTELQDAVMKMRMQPVSNIFKKFPRLVRDLARDSQKAIDLQIFGETTEVDKSVLEEIGDPLVHILRNSCDHGIESPEDRTAKGKPEKGTIKLSAAQEGSHIVIKVEDDGKGFDLEAIKEKAIERGLSTKAELDNMLDKQIFGFIFEAGFSTARQVTGVSGRGVGMDVVRTNIEKLNGIIELDSQKDVGTTITIKLPLTLAIVQGLLIVVNDETYVIPLSSVLETVRIDQEEITYMNKRPVLNLRDEVIPLIDLDAVLKNKTTDLILTEKPYVVIVALGNKKLGIMIDKFLGQEEVVIKSLGRYLNNTAGLAGATILGDGHIRLIIDIIGLFNLAQKYNRV